jgi:hypothetical protein
MSKIKTIEPNEPFIMDGRVFIYLVENGSLKLKLSTQTNDKIKPTKTFIPPTIDEVKAYFKEKGYKAEGAQKAFDYYTTMEWKDSNDKPVKNWKGKMIANWMRPEYLIKSTNGTNNSFFQE